MKYTVVIRQPIQEDVRPELEKQLVERFGLKAQQAEKLAVRRAGRLLKPTTQARANLLLEVYQSVGAQVVLEEVPEDSDAVGLGVAPTLSGSAAGAAAAFGTPGLSSQSLSGQSLGATPDFGDVFSASSSSASPAADPFAASANPFMGAFGQSAGSTGSGGDPGAGAGSSAADDMFGPAAGKTTEVIASSVPLLSSSASSSEAAIAQEIALTPAPPKPADDWADFAGGLNLPETAAPQTQVQSAQPSTEFLTAVATEPDEAPVQNLPRTSLTNQLRLGTLIPLLLSSLLTLGVLAAVLPSVQNRVLSQDAHTLAATLASNLSTGSRSQANLQIDNILKNSNVGFVRVALPDGSTFVRTRNDKVNDKVNDQLTEWLKGHPNGGAVNVEGQSYIASRVSVIEDRNGLPLVTDFANEKGGTLVRRVTVGLPTQDTRTALLTTLALTVGSALLGLLLASWLAARAARRIVQPIEQLVKVADAISLGDLSRPVKATTNDELGDLAQALERMRLSLEAAMDRLRRRKRG